MSDIKEDVILSLLLKKYSTLYRCEAGSILLGHNPKRAPKAFDIILFRGCTQDEISQEMKRANLNIPEPYQQFLKIYNGITFSNIGVNLMGIILHPIRHAMTPLNYPSSLSHINQIKTINPFVIGYDKHSDDYLLLNPSGTVFYSKEPQNIHDNVMSFVVKTVSENYGLMT